MINTSTHWFDPDGRGISKFFLKKEFYKPIMRREVFTPYAPCNRCDDKQHVEKQIQSFNYKKQYKIKH